MEPWRATTVRFRVETVLASAWDRSATHWAARFAHVLRAEVVHTPGRACTEGGQSQVEPLRTNNRIRGSVRRATCTKS